MKHISNPLANLIQEFDLPPTPRVHLIGACGSGMKALADVLLDAGWILSGSDANPDPQSLRTLAQRNLTIAADHRSNLKKPDTDLVIYSAAIRPENPERAQAESLSIPQMSYVEAMAQIFNSSPGIAVCGTHGKSSTTALLVHLFQSLGRHPTYFCGAQRVVDGRSGRLGDDAVSIAEACEFRRHFLKLRPNAICLLNIEEDHFDCYPTIDDAVATYREFVSSLPKEGRLIWNADCSRSQAIATELSLEHTTLEQASFSTRTDSVTWFGRRSGSQVEIFHQGESLLQTQFPLAGEHALSNLLAALASTAAIGEINVPAFRLAIPEYRGLKRRFEMIDCEQGRTLIDDYAHHPTEIRATLTAAREQFPNSKLCCYYQPHQILRTKRLMDDFATALVLADEVVILPVYAARETGGNEEIFTSQKLVARVNDFGRACRFLPSLDQLPKRLQTSIQSNEIVLTLGAGDINRIHDDRT